VKGFPQSSTLRGSFTTYVILYKIYRKISCRTRKGRS